MLPRLAAALAAPLLAATLLAACRDPAPAPASASARRYVFRAEVVRVPPPGAPAELTLRHEAIDGFADATGKVVGMGAMVMPFAVAPGVSLAGVAPGDKVRATLVVDLAVPSYAIVALEELPADTALEFRAARPPPP